MVEKAFFSGQLGSSVFKADEDVFIMYASNVDAVKVCTPYEEKLFFDSAAEISLLENISRDVLKKNLLKEKKCFDALYSAIAGFDGNLSREARLLSLHSAEKLLEDKDVYIFVKSRLLGTSPPREARLAEAVLISKGENCSILYDLYKEMILLRSAPEDLELKNSKDNTIKFLDIEDGKIIYRPPMSSADMVASKNGLEEYRLAAQKSRKKKKTEKKD